MTTPPEETDPNPLQILAAETENPYPMYSLKIDARPDEGATLDHYVIKVSLVFPETVPVNRRDWLVHDVITGLEMQGYHLSPSGEASYAFVQSPEDEGFYHTEAAANLLPMPVSKGPNPNR